MTRWPDHYVRPCAELVCRTLAPPGARVPFSSAILCDGIVRQLGHWRGSLEPTVPLQRHMSAAIPPPLAAHCQMVCGRRNARCSHCSKAYADASVGRAHLVWPPIERATSRPSRILALPQRHIQPLNPPPLNTLGRGGCESWLRMKSTAGHLHAECVLSA